VARLLLCGDVNVQDRADPREVFGLVKSPLSDADLRFCDLEMCLYRPSALIAEKPGWTQSDERMVESLTDARFEVVSTANNVNAGTEAILSTLRVLDANGIAHTGSGPNLAAARAPAVVERAGLRFGFLAYTAVYYRQGHAAGSSEPGVATIRCHTAYQPHSRVHEMPGAPAITRSWPDPATLAALTADVAVLRPLVDVLVCYFHWGVSSMEELAEYQSAVGRHVVDQGADLVVGSHAHVPQAVEVYRDRAILYGLGNFAFDWVNMRTRRSGLIAQVDLDGAKIVRVGVRPVWRHDDALNRPEIVPLDHPRGAEIVARVAHLSQGLGARLEQGDDLLVWNRG
jgi:poly-gamma-glutamate capsule biosynthesis protein CapA/YwtB (metallophosphatase superfamily)